MNKSESIKNIAVALAKFQAEVKNPKNTSNNPFTESRYAPLNEILNVIRPLLAKHGLSVFQSTGGNGETISVTTMLLHESGEWLESDPLVLHNIENKKMSTAQEAGSSITYARRYSLSALLGISSEDDVDGNGANKKEPGKNNYNKGNQSNKNNQQQPKKITDNQLNKFKNLYNKLTKAGISIKEMNTKISKELGKVFNDAKSLNVSEASKIIGFLEKMEKDIQKKPEDDNLPWEG